MNLGKLKELEAKATKGPWFTTSWGQFNNDTPDPKKTVWTVGRDSLDVNWENDADCRGYGIRKADADLIAEMRNALPDLLSEIDRLLEENQKLISYKLNLAANVFKVTQENEYLKKRLEEK